MNKSFNQTLNNKKILHWSDLKWFHVGPYLWLQITILVFLALTASARTVNQLWFLALGRFGTWGPPSLRLQHNQSKQINMFIASLFLQCFFYLAIKNAKFDIRQALNNKYVLTERSLIIFSKALLSAQNHHLCHSCNLYCCCCQTITASAPSYSWQILNLLASLSSSENKPINQSREMN
jgi:hypothetical protein